MYRQIFLLPTLAAFLIGNLSRL